MLFQKDYAIKSNNCRSQKTQKINVLLRTIQTERASLCLQHLKGSLAIEAALILPLFLYACMLFLGFLQVLRVQTAVEQALYITGRELSVYAYAMNSGTDLLQRGEADGDVLVSGGGQLYIQSRMEQQLTDIGVCRNRSYHLSSFMDEEETMDIVICYEVNLPVRFLKAGRLEFVQRAKWKLWTGYAGTDANETEEQFVYITETGSVYHTNEACTHIRLSVQKITGADISGARNDYGGKYYACERCTRDGNTGSMVFITSSGDRYHKNAACSGLKRRIMVIPVSEAGDRSHCMRCRGN